MSLIQITEKTHNVILDIAYATPFNFTEKKIYENAFCYIHKDAENKLNKAAFLAQQLDLKIKIFDAFRPQQAQQKLWNHTPDPIFIIPPESGSHHTRGVAIDLTLVDEKTSAPLPMGTNFDDFSEKAFHSNTDITAEAQRNRKILLGIMTTAGWDNYEKEWWHYQLFKPREYPLIQSGIESNKIMGLN